jgi:hypothetical protein
MSAKQKFMGFVAQSLPACLGRHGKWREERAWRGVWADHEHTWRVKEETVPLACSVPQERRNWGEEKEGEQRRGC